MTEFERIKAMSFDELAEFLNGAIDDICFEICEDKTGNKFQCPDECHDCSKCIKQWLESEVEDNAE